MNSIDDNPLRRFAPLRILVVDDDPVVVRVAVDHYSALGFEVHTAADGVSALHQMEKMLPDVVLCDRRMPELSGAELLETIRNRGPEWQQVTFIFVTSLIDRRDRYQMLPLHPNGYFCKPIDFDREDERLAEILSSRRAIASTL